MSFWLCSRRLLFIWSVDNLGCGSSCWDDFLTIVHGSTPFELVNEGDLLLLIDRMLHLRGRDTVSDF